MIRIFIAVMMLAISTLAYADKPSYETLTFTFSKTGQYSYEYKLHHTGEDITGIGRDADEAYANFFYKMGWVVDRIGDHVHIFNRLADDGWKMVSLTMTGKDDSTYARQWLFKRSIE